jgi:hypothetical protein
VKEADVLLWRPTPSTVFLRGWSTTTVQLYAGTAGAGLPLVGVAWAVCCLPSLSSCSALERTELTWMCSVPSRGTTREEALWSLAVLVVVLLMRRLLMRVFFVGLRSSVYPWAEAGPLKGPRSRWTVIPRYPEHRQQPPGAWPANAPSQGSEGSGPPRSCWALQRHASTRAVRGLCEDVEAADAWIYLCLEHPT